MSAIIDGASGPFPAGVAGHYGRNAAHNSLRHSANIRNMDDLKRPLRFTPADSLNTDAFYRNLFGFSEEVSKHFDKDKSGGLNLREFTEMSKSLIDAFIKPLGILGSIFKPLVSSLGAAQIKKLFDTQDRDKNGELDVVEGAANTLFLDDASTFLGQKLIATAPDAKRKTLAELQAKELLRNYPSRLDGQITDAERNGGIREGFLAKPELTGQILDDLIQDHDLRKRYQAFRKPKP